MPVAPKTYLKHEMRFIVNIIRDCLDANEFKINNDNARGLHSLYDKDLNINSQMIVSNNDTSLMFTYAELRLCIFRYHVETQYDTCINLQTSSGTYLTST